MAYNTRVGASAVIVREGAILLVSFDEPGGDFHYNLPGGGLEQGEDTHTAVRRETLEEAGAEIEVGRLLLAGEYEPPNSVGEHALKLVFECPLKGELPTGPQTPDACQLGIEWVPLDQLSTVPLLPPIASQLIAALKGPLDDPYLPLNRKPYVDES
jgi:ADP-ribose pyrophosphatase YjhB (NUDIX family)